MPTPLTFFTRSLVCSLALALLPTVSAAQDGARSHPALLQALNQLRQQGCAAGSAPVGALRESADLTRAAMMVSGGATMVDALRSLSYRAVRATQIQVSGAMGPSALAARALGQSCSAALNPELLDVGFHQMGKNTWVVLAAPFVPPQAAQADEMQDQVLALVNQARATARRCGKDYFAPARPLRLNRTLQQVAAGHATDMARQGYFSHTGRDGSSADVRASRQGYRWRAIGENLATGLMQADTAVQGWLDSPGHCASLMSPAFEETGVAFALSNIGNQGLYWVQMFGTPR